MLWTQQVQDQLLTLLTSILLTKGLRGKVLLRESGEQRWMNSSVPAVDGATQTSGERTTNIRWGLVVRCLREIENSFRCLVEMTLERAFTICLSPW